MSVGICYASVSKNHFAPTTPLHSWLPENPRIASKLRMRQLAPALVLFLVLCFQVSVRIGIIAEGYRLESQRTQALQQDQSIRQYRLQYAYLTSPSRVAAQSRARLGMLPNRPQQLRRISEINSSRN